MFANTDQILEGTDFEAIINSLLTNSESWYGLKESEIKQLEQVDEMLIRK